MVGTKKDMNVETNETLCFSSKSLFSRQDDEQTINSTARKLTLTIVSKFDGALESPKNRV